MKETLEGAEIPFKKVECYGSQIVITAWSQEAANKWATLLGTFSEVRGQTRGLDEKFDAKPGTPPSQKYTQVFRVFAALDGGK
jgi:hypothetical protein